MTGRVSESVVMTGMPLSFVETSPETTKKNQPGKLNPDVGVDFVADSSALNFPPPSLVPVNTKSPLREMTENFIQWRMSIILLAGLIIAWLFYSGMSALLAAWYQNPLIGGGFTLLSCVLILQVSIVVRNEYLSLQAIDILSLSKDEIAKAKEKNDIEDLRKALAPIIFQLNKTEHELISKFENTICSERSISCNFYLDAFNTIVIQPLDSKVNTLIKGETLGVALGTAMLPHPVLDALFVFWRSVKLNRSVASAYGLKATNLAAIKLSKHALSAVLAAGTAVVTEEVAKSFVAQLLGKLVEKSTQGAMNGMRMYRLGKQIQNICRPI